MPPERLGHAWTDLDRPPLSVARLRRALADGSLGRDLTVVASTRSTNADVAAAARAGAPEGTVVVADAQTGGRGRLDRSWTSPPRAGLLVSVLLRPAGVPPGALPLVPLLAGVAVVEALHGVARVDGARLKWPNDVVVDDAKLGGILVERVDEAVVVGIGLNVSTRADELPVATATSVALAGGRADREPLLKEVLRALARRYDGWRAAAGAASAVLPAYRAVSATVGRDVAVDVPGGRRVEGVAVAVDDAGRLVVRGPDGEDAWSAGDVEHVRPRR